MASSDGSMAVTNKCEAGRLCRFAHSSEEVLYHPLIYKTTICEEYAKQNVQRNARGTFGNKKRCQQYYCPFAHGEEELRTSSIHPDHITMYLSALQAFTSGENGKVSVPKDGISNPKEEIIDAQQQSPLEEAYANLKPEDLLLFPPILATSPALRLWADQQMWTSPKIGDLALSQTNLKDDMFAMKTKSCLVPPPPLYPSQYKQLADHPKGNQENGWPNNSFAPMKVQTECNGRNQTSHISIDEDEDDSDQIFRDLSAYMYEML
jgi:hypothetical protein